MMKYPHHFREDKTHVKVYFTASGHDDCSRTWNFFHCIYDYEFNARKCGSTDPWTERLTGTSRQTGSRVGTDRSILCSIF